MTAPKSKIRDLLAVLQAKNSREFPDLLPQQIQPPLAHSSQIATLERSHCRPISRMLKERFNYAGSWVNACFGQTWLSQPDIERAWSSRPIQEQIALRRQHWEQSVVAKYPLSRISIFGIDRQDCEETYLLWPSGSRGEPEFFLYTNSEERQFADFASLLRFLIE